LIQEIERNLGSLERQAQAESPRLPVNNKDELFEKEITWGRSQSQNHRG